MASTSFQIIRYLSSGRFGKVYLVNMLNQDGSSSDDYKVLKQNILETPLVPYEVVRESTIANEIRNNPRICAASNVYLGDKYMFLLMDYLDGTLSDIVDELEVIFDPHKIDKAEEKAEFALKDFIEEQNQDDMDIDDVDYDEEEEETGCSDRPAEKLNEEDEDDINVENNNNDGEEKEEAEEAELDYSNASSHLSQIDPLLFENGSKITFRHEAIDDTKTCTTILTSFTVECCPEAALSEEQVQEMESKRLLDLRTCLYDHYNVVTRVSRNSEIKHINKTKYKHFWLNMTKQLLQVMNELEQYGYMHDDFRLGNVGYRILDDNSLQLVAIDFSQVKRLSNHYDASNRVPDFPSCPSEVFFREPIVNQAFDTRAVGNCSGALLDPFDKFFSNFDNEQEYKDLLNSSDEEEDCDDNDDNNGNDNVDDGSDAAKEEDCWAGLEPEHCYWFTDKCEKYGLFQRINKLTGKNFDDEGLETEEVADDDVKAGEEKQLAEKMELQLKNDQDSEEPKEEYDEKKYMIVDIDPSNLHDFAHHIQKRRSYAKLIDYWMLVWWLQMFIRDPTKRPTVQALLKQLEDPETMNITKPKVPKKRKASVPVVQLPPEIPTENWQPALYTQHNPANWSYNPDNGSNNNNHYIVNIELTEIQRKAMNVALQEIEQEIVNEFEDYPLVTVMPNNLQLLLLATELYSLYLSQQKEVVDFVKTYKMCFLLSERWFGIYNRQLKSMDDEEETQTLFQRSMFQILVAVGGKVDRINSWYNQILAILNRSYAGKQIPEIINAEIKSYRNLYERPITFFEIWYNTSLFHVWTNIHNNNQTTQINFEEVVEQAFAQSSEMVMLETNNHDHKNLLQRQLICCNFPQNFSLLAASS